MARQNKPNTQKNNDTKQLAYYHIGLGLNRMTYKTMYRKNVYFGWSILEIWTRLYWNIFYRSNRQVSMDSSNGLASNMRKVIIITKVDQDIRRLLSLLDHNQSYLVYFVRICLNYIEHKLLIHASKTHTIPTNFIYDILHINTLISSINRAFDRNNLLFLFSNLQRCMAKHKEQWRYHLR